MKRLLQLAFILSMAVSLAAQVQIGTNANVGVNTLVCTPPPAPTNTPFFSPAPGIYPVGTPISISGCTGKSYWYRTDGLTAATTIASPLYSSPLTFSTPGTYTLSTICATMGAYQTNTEADSASAKCNDAPAGSTTYPSGLTCYHSGGVVGTPTDVGWTIASPASLYVTAPASSGTETQVLFSHLFGGGGQPAGPCDSCSVEVQDIVFKITEGLSGLAHLELDIPQYDPTHGNTDRQNGMHFDLTTGYWYVDSGNAGGWKKTSVSGSLTQGTTYELVDHVTHDLTGPCPGGLGCAYYDFMDFNGVYSALGGSYGNTQGYSSATGSAYGHQIQTEQLPTSGSPSTVTVQVLSGTVALGKGDESPVTVGAYTFENVLATPTATPAAGTYSSTQNVSLNLPSGSTGCYTINGSTPSGTSGSCGSGSTTYTGPITVSSNTTIKAIATESGFINSNVFSGAWTITGGTSSATPILVPNIGATGNNALAAPSPVLAFGKQGTGTSSPALPISISNCSNPQYATTFGICGGSGSLTVSSMAISGANASDFTLSGTCGLIASGSDCEPTITFKPSASSGTNETATLTVTDNASPSTQTMSLTGTSATVTTLSTSACPTTLTGGVNYQLTADISCGGTAFILGGSGTDVNLNGHTVTYGTASQSTQINGFGVASGNFSAEPVIHNGTITHGAGTNSLPAGTIPGSSLIGGPSASVSGWGLNGTQFFNLTLNQNLQYASAIDIRSGGNFIAHDNIINDTAIGNCNNTGCRDELQSSTIIQYNSSTDTTGTSELYNNTQNGGPQGGFMLTSPNAVMEYNTVNPGNVLGTNTNNFALNCWGNGCVVAYNSVMTPLTGNSDSRGITINAASVTGLTGANVHNNVVNSFGNPNNSEYGGCAGGGTYSFQVDDNPAGPNTVQNNYFAGTADVCGNGALRVTDSEYSTNLSENNTWVDSRESGAGSCTRSPDQGPQPGCANASEWDTPTGFTSENDTFTADSCDVLLDVSGASGIVIQSPTFNKGSNPSDFHTFCAENGTPSQGGGPVTNFHVIDATFNAGTSSTDTDFPQYNVGNQGDVSLYIDWTQNMTVNKASGPAASGALVTFTDTLSNTYTCTTNSSGVCAVPVTQYRNNNDTAANQHENRNPYGLSVSLSGCTTNTQSGLTISATGRRTITLSGC